MERYPEAEFLGKAVHARGTFKRGRPTLIIQHYTAGGSGRADARMLQGNNPGPVSCHFVIDRDGTVYQCGELDQVLFHAGVSAWRGQVGINEYGIGIENANYGYWRPGLPIGSAENAVKRGWVRSQHKFHKGHGPVQIWEPYPRAQMDANVRLTKWLLAKFPSVKEDPVGHDDISPGRKSDPGPAFPWELFKGLRTTQDAQDLGKFSVTADTLNVRGGPGTSFEVLRSLKRGAAVTVLQDRGEWSYVRDDAGEGWVFDQYIAPK